MSTFYSLEEIKAWKKARLLIKEIYSISSQGSFARDFGLRDQIREASVSITSNIAEGFERDGNAEFIHFLSLAKGSAGEVQSQFQNAVDVGYINELDCHRLQEDAIIIKKMLASLIYYLRNLLLKAINSISLKPASN